MWTCVADWGLVIVSYAWLGFILILVFFRLSGQRDKKCVLYKMNRSIIVKIIPWNIPWFVVYYNTSVCSFNSMQSFIMHTLLSHIIFILWWTKTLNGMYMHILWNWTLCFSLHTYIVAQNILTNTFSLCLVVQINNCSEKYTCNTCRHIVTQVSPILHMHLFCVVCNIWFQLLLLQSVLQKWLQWLQQW